MAAVFDIDGHAVINLRAAIIILPGGQGKRNQHIEGGQHAGILLNMAHILSHKGYQVGKQLLLQHLQAALGSQNFLFVHFKLFGDIALGIHQGLLAYPLGWHLVLMCIAHLQVVAKHLIVGNFQRADAGALYLPVAYLHQVVLAGISDAAQLIKLGIYSVFDDASLLQLGRSFLVELLFQALL